jgi:hypothetical protein|uniref:Uncharacterized protein n=1 Tax=Sphingobacterium sp. (strain 21) TaxID=743722 RepID=F4CEW4_SPHS2
MKLKGNHHSAFISQSSLLFMLIFIHQPIRLQVMQKTTILQNGLELILKVSGIIKDIFVFYFTCIIFVTG